MPRIEKKGNANNEHDEMVFTLSDILFETAMTWVVKFVKSKDHDEKECLKAHSILYNSCMNFASRAIDTLAESITDEEEKKKFVEKAKENICMSIDLAKEMKEMDKKGLQ